MDWCRLFICDRTKCGDKCWDGCYRTLDPTHAAPEAEISDMHELDSMYVITNE